jgi:hypothetical protein
MIFTLTSEKKDIFFILKAKNPPTRGSSLNILDELWADESKVKGVSLK